MKKDEEEEEDGKKKKRTISLRYRHYSSVELDKMNSTHAELTNCFRIDEK